MILFLIIFLGIIIILPIIILVRITVLGNEIRQMNYAINSLLMSKTQPATQEKAVAVQAEVQPEVEVQPIQEFQKTPEVYAAAEISPLPELVIEPEQEIIQESVPQEMYPEPEEEKIEYIVSPVGDESPVLPEIKVIEEQTAFDKLPETTNWLSRIGIVTLVLGIGFFVKYAIDQNWINEIGRVGIGFLTGGIIIGIAHYLRTKYRVFSSLLAGGGIAVFYITITIAFREYALFGQSAAFVLLIITTLF